MSILIKGMEMPTRCGDCLFYGLESAGNGMYWDYCRCKCQLIDSPDTERRSDCPLVPVPPHGRLIDADALRQSIKESIDECHKWAEEVDEGEMYARVSQALGTFVECSLRVKAAPTIIPSEEGEI